MTDLDGGTRRVLTGLTVANGVGFSPDGATCCLVDSGPGIVWAFEYTDGVLGRRRPLVVVDGPGAADGLCLDDEGCLDDAQRRAPPWAGRLFSVDVAMRGPAADPYRGPVTGWTERPDGSA